MCTYLTEKVDVTGSGKGGAGWFKLSEASVYFDHPVHAPAEHTLNIDFRNPGQGPSARVAVELTAESACAVAKAIEATPASAPPGRAGGPPCPGGAPRPGFPASFPRRSAPAPWPRRSRRLGRRGKLLQAR